MKIEHILMRAARDAERHQFLTAQGWAPSAERPLAADASFRRYFRLEGPTGTAVLMDAPPPQEDVRPFVKLANHLRKLGLSAPRVDAVDEVRGFVLLEDLGDETFSRRLHAGAETRALYTLAIDTLIHLQREPEATAVEVPNYDMEKLLAEASLLVDWYMPAKHGETAEPSVRDAYLSAWRELLEPTVAGPRTLVLRDYHVDNLMELSAREGTSACGLLDFQDALIGSPAYDLVSLLEDARRDVPADLTSAMLERYFGAFPEFDDHRFRASYELLGAQRHCKVAGIFVRLWLRDGKPGYLPHIPRVMGLLEAALRQPALASLKNWFDRHLPDRLEPLPVLDRERLKPLF